MRLPGVDARRFERLADGLGRFSGLSVAVIRSLAALDTLAEGAAELFVDTVDILQESGCRLGGVFRRPDADDVRLATVGAHGRLDVAVVVVEVALEVGHVVDDVLRVGRGVEHQRVVAGVVRVALVQPQPTESLCGVVYLLEVS